MECKSWLECLPVPGHPVSKLSMIKNFKLWTVDCVHHVPSSVGRVSQWTFNPNNPLPLGLVSICQYCGSNGEHSFFFSMIDADLWVETFLVVWGSWMVDSRRRIIASRCICFLHSWGVNQIAFMLGWQCISWSMNSSKILEFYCIWCPHNGVSYPWKRFTEDVKLGCTSDETTRVHTNMIHTSKRIHGWKFELKWFWLMERITLCPTLHQY